MGQLTRIGSPRFSASSAGSFVTPLRIATFGLVVALASCNALAQRHNRDYYAPRLTSDDTQLFNNVESFHLEPGRQELKSKRFKAALDHAEFMLRYYPNHPQALDLLSQICVSWGSNPRCDADAAFELAIARRPEASRTYLVYGIHLQRVKRVDDAVRNYKRAIDLDPGSMNAHYNLGLAYESQKKYALANDAAQRAYALGAQLPGLRDKLKAVNAWRVTVSEPTAPEGRKDLGPVGGIKTEGQ